MGYFWDFAKQRFPSKSVRFRRGKIRKVNKSEKIPTDTKIHPGSRQIDEFHTRTAFT